MDTDNNETPANAMAETACWALIVLYAASMLAAALFPGLAAAAFPLQLALLSIFAMLHGSARYGPLGMLVFLASMLIVVNVIENISIHTGVPFGNFHHTDATGPKLFSVPLVTGFAYFSAGYVAWMLATILLGESDRQQGTWALLSTPIVAMFIVTGWDACIDPIGGTVARNWVWEDGGGYFGVPLSNYLGWMITTYIAYQLFAAYLASRDAEVKPAQSHGWWLQPPVQFLIMALQYPLYLLTGPAAQVTDPAGTVWNTADIFEGTTVVSLFTMMFVAVTCLLIVLKGKQST